MAHRIRRVAGSAARAAIVPRREVERSVKGAWERRSETLFPGYLIVPTRDADALAQALALITDFNYLLKTGGIPATLSEQEVSTLIALSDDEWVVRPSVGAIVDGALTVSMGPLAGLEELIGRIDRHRRRAYFKPGAFPLLMGTSAGRRAARGEDRLLARAPRASARPPFVGLNVVSKT